MIRVNVMVYVLSREKCVCVACVRSEFGRGTFFVQTLNSKILCEGGLCVRALQMILYRPVY